MMKKHCIIFLFMLFIFYHVTFSQPWGEQNSGVTVQLTSVSSSDGYSAWACGYNGTVLKSGWVNVSGNGIPPTIQLVNVFAITASSALVAGYIGSNTWVYYTSNSGANWVQVFTQTGGFINAISIKLDGTGIMVGDPVGGRWSLWRTTNNGLNWDSSGLYLPQVAAETGYNNSLAYSQNRIWFGTNNSRIYHSTNNGTNWSIQTTLELDITAIWFDVNGASTGYAGGNTLLKTTNNGANWTTVTSMGTGLIVGIAGLTMWSGNIWYVRSGGSSIYYTDGNGYNMIDYTAPAGTYRHIASDRIPNFPYIGIAVRNNGGITYKQIFVQGINNIGGEIPSSYSLSQNYPNPFNPTTKLKFQMPKSGFVKLTVYNLLGKEIQTLVNQQLSAGTYEVDFDGSRLSSGVYYYKLQTGSFTETKKMILLK